jgi:predicted GH43/DUF377 family glycosyl hydrolase
MEYAPRRRAPADDQPGALSAEYDDADSFNAVLATVDELIRITYRAVVGDFARHKIAHSGVEIAADRKPAIHQSRR